MSTCFACTEGGNCRVLTLGKCVDGCKFRKTQQQFQSDRAKAAERISTLDEATQFYISFKYNNGKR